MITRIEYAAYLHYLVERDNNRKINWDAPVFQRYLEWHNSKSGVAEPVNFELESNRKNFARKATRYALLAANGKVILGKLEKVDETGKNGKAVFAKKRVICEDEYNSLLKEHHDGKNHLGFIKCYYEMRQLYAKVDSVQVKQYIKNCRWCQTHKAILAKKSHNTPICVYGVFERLGMDLTEFVDNRGGAEQKHIILVMEDYFSRFSWAIILANSTAEEIAFHLYDLCLTLALVPNTVQSDNGTQFVGKVVRDLMQRFQVDVKLAKPRSPWTGGRFERLIQSLKQMLVAKLHEFPTYSVELALKICLFDYNTRRHEALSSFGQSLAPVDVWTAGNRQRRLQQKITMDLHGNAAGKTLETVEEDGPEFNEESAKLLFGNAEDTRAKATRGSMIAEGRIITAGKDINQDISVGDIGLVEVPKEDRQKHGQRNLLVQVMDLENNQLVLAPLIDSGLGPNLRIRYSMEAFLKVENCNPTDVKDRAEVILGPETPKVTQWKQEFFRRRVLAAEIYSRCVDDCNLLFYLSARESGFTVNDALLDASQPSALATSELFAWVKAALQHCLTKRDEIGQQECMLALIQVTIEAAIGNRCELQVDKCRTIHPSTRRFLSEMECLTIPGIEGLPDELSCKLAARIVIAALMKQKPDSRLNQLSKLWKTNDAGHARCGQCKRAVMMWVRWQCKVCKSYFCFECYSAEISGISEHGIGKDSHKAVFEKGYLPYKKEDPTESIGQKRNGEQSFDVSQQSDIHDSVPKKETQKDFKLSMRGAVKLQSAQADTSLTRTIGGPCTCHKSKPCNSYKCRCVQANTPCTDECKCSQYICFFNNFVGKDGTGRNIKESTSQKKTRKLLRGHGFSNIGSNCYVNCVLWLLKFVSVMDTLRQSDDIPEDCVVLKAIAKTYNLTSKDGKVNAEEYESSMSELLTSIKWDQGARGVGQWNDPMEFLECLLEKMQEDLEDQVALGEELTATFKRTFVSLVAESDPNTGENKNCFRILTKYIAIPMGWPARSSFHSLLEDTFTDAIDAKVAGDERTIFHYIDTASFLILGVDRSDNQEAEIEVPLSIAKFSFTNPGELPTIKESTGGNLHLWGAISYQLGHFTSFVRCSLDSDDWLKFDDDHDPVSMSYKGKVEELINKTSYVLIYATESELGISVQFPVLEDEAWLPQVDALDSKRAEKPESRSVKKRKKRKSVVERARNSELDADSADDFDADTFSRKRRKTKSASNLSEDSNDDPVVRHSTPRSSLQEPPCTPDSDDLEVKFGPHPSTDYSHGYDSTEQDNRSHSRATKTPPSNNKKKKRNISIKDKGKEWRKQFLPKITEGKKGYSSSSSEAESIKGNDQPTDTKYFLEKISKRLEKIVGLEHLKSQILTWAKSVFLDRLRMVEADQKRQKKVPSVYHMLFIGNPGTGKTTIARLMADILRDLGIIKKSKMIEVQRPDLVGRFLGETSLRTKECLEKASGGVLFVDEAYRLRVADSDKDYGREALETLMQSMLSGDPVMIFAGYPTQMADFVKLNPGFSRRIRTTFRFPEYSCEELAQMFLNMTLERGFTTEVSLEEIKDLIEKSTNEEFRKQWNAGVSEKIFTLAKEHLDERLISDSLSLVAEKRDIAKFTKDDICCAMESLGQD